MFIISGSKVPGDC